MSIPEETTRYVEKYPDYRLGYQAIVKDRSRPLIVLIHGLASNHTRWSEFMQNTVLLDRFNFLRIDLMGHGLSLQRRRVTRQGCCDDIAAILKQEEFSKAIVVGHSLGAQVAIEFAHSYPSICNGVILIDITFPHLLHGTLGWVRKLQKMIWSVMWITFGLNALGLRRKHFELRDLQQLDQQTRNQLKGDQVEGDQTIASLYMNPLPDLKYIPLAIYLQDMYELVQPLPKLEDVHAKVLAIVSSGAQISDREETIQQIHRFPSGEIQSIQADHWPLTENPEQTRKIIEQWCEQFE